MISSNGDLASLLAGSGKGALVARAPGDDTLGRQGVRLVGAQQTMYKPRKKKEDGAQAQSRVHPSLAGRVQQSHIYMLHATMCYLNVVSKIPRNCL